MIDRDIAARVAAFRGNPEALMQQYQQSQNLLDLLALQKIKSEKEAAMRDMQLKMAQSGKPPTIAQQREQEVLSMTKDELLQQQRGLLDRKQQAQQEAIQELAAARNPAAGVPTLPTPDVMPEQAMAAGGIVTFSDGGAEWEKVNRDYARGQGRREEERFRILAEELRAAQRKADAGDARAAQDVTMLQRELRRIKPAPSADAGIGALLPAAQAAEPKPTTQVRRAAPVEEAVYDPMTGVQISGPSRATESPMAQMSAPEVLATIVDPGYRPYRPPQQAKPQAAPTMPRVDVSGGATADQAADIQARESGDPIGDIIAQAQAQRAQAATPAAGIVSVVPPEFKDLTGSYTKSVMGALGVNPEEVARAREAEFTEAVGLPTEREMEAARTRLGEFQKRQEEIAKAQRRRAFFDALAGAGGATFEQTLGGISRDVSAAQTRAEQEELDRLRARDVALQGLAEAGIKLRGETLTRRTTGRKEAEERGDKARTEAGLGVRGALTAQTSRDIAEAQRDANSIQNEGLRQNRIETLRRQTLTGSIELKSLFAQREQLSNMAALGAKLTPAQQQELQTIDKKIQLITDEINSRFDDMLTSRGAPVTTGGSGAFKVERIQ